MILILTKLMISIFTFMMNRKISFFKRTKKNNNLLLTKENLDFGVLMLQ